MLHNIIIIIRFELVKNFKKVGFWMFPIAMVALTILGSAVGGLATSFVLNDRSDALIVTTIDTIGLINATNSDQSVLITYDVVDTTEEIARERLQKEELTSVLVIRSLDDIEFIDTANARVFLTDIDLDITRRVLEFQQEDTEAAIIIPKISISRVAVAQDRENVVQGINYAISGILMALIFIFGSLFMNQIIVEKNTKVYELILSSISTKELFIGKYLSFLAKLGIQFAVSIITAVVSVLAVIVIAGTFFGDAFASSTSSDQLTISDSSASSGFEEFELFVQLVSIFNWQNILATLIYGILGIFLYSILMSMIGASFNNYMEASNSALSSILQIPILIAFGLNFYFIPNPDSPFAIFFQLFPLTSPVSSASFLYSNFNWWVVIISWILLLASIYFAFIIATKVYLEGALSTNKITLKQLWKVLRG